jgi:hypothetical protein
VDPSSSVPALEGLAIEAVEWLPSGSDAGLVRVRGRWTDLGRSERELPALGLRRGPEARRFESLPDARFGRDPAVWRATYLVPAALMDPPPDELWLAWDSGVRAGLPAPTHGFEPPAAPPAPVEPEPEGEVIDRAVLAERRARRAEASERAQAQRAAEALKAVEVLELRGAELERRLEALQEEKPPGGEVAPESSGVVEAERESSSEVAADPARSADDAASPSSPAAASLAAAPAVPHTIPSAPQADALATAVATVKRLRGELADQRQRVRRSELLRAADAVALASLQDEHGRARRLEQQLAVSERDLARAIADAEAAAGEALSAREQAAEQVALAQQRAAADAAAVRTRSAEELAAERERAGAAQAAVAEARAELQVARHDLASARERLAARERELSAIGAELSALREELERVRHDAAGRTADLERRLAELDTALAAERRGHAGTATELESAQAQLALAEAANRAESVARAALDEEIDRERLARATLAEALDVAQSELAQAQTFQADLVLSREQARAEATAAQTQLAAAGAEGDSAQRAAEELRAALAAARAEGDSARQAADEVGAALAAARAEGESARQEAEELRATLAAARAGSGRTEGALAAARQELEAARLRIAHLERELEERRASTEHQTGGLLARIAELERSADDDLERRAREQAEAAAAAARPADAERLELSANLDAAAAALRARVDEPDAAASHAPEPAATTTPAQPALPPVGPSIDPSAVGEVAADVSAVEAVDESAADVSAAEAVAASSSGEAASVAAPARAPASTPPPRPRIVTEAKHPPRADVVGSSKREYPWLRGALVKLAHDDPRAATRLLLGLVPVQRALVPPPVEYDLTIRGDGTYAISIGQQGATAKPLPGPRPRRQAAYHLSADVVTLAELLAGVPKRMGRWFGPIKVHGRRRGAEALRDALVGARLDLAAAARAGAELDPELVFRAFAYAIHPAWTKGHSFTVAQEIADPSPQRWHVLVRDGAPVAVERRATTAPDAVVTMTRATYLHLLRGERAPSGERPAIRGDRAAVALLRAWTERAQGQDA